MANKLNENSIREAAYYLWQNAGCPNGNDDYFWSQAIEQLNSKTSMKKTASCKTTSCTKKSISTKKSK